MSNWTPLKMGVLSSMLLRKKYSVSMRVLNLLQDFFVSCLNVLVVLGTKDKRLVRTENSSSVNAWSERLCIIFFLYCEVYVLMELAVNLRNEDLHWFSGKRTFIWWSCVYAFQWGYRIKGYFFYFHVILHFLVNTKCFFLYQRILNIVEGKSLWDS